MLKTFSTDLSNNTEPDSMPPEEAMFHMIKEIFQSNVGLIIEMQIGTKEKIIEVLADHPSWKDLNTVHPNPYIKMLAEEIKRDIVEYAKLPEEEIENAYTEFRTDYLLSIKSRLPTIEQENTPTARPNKIHQYLQKT